MPAGVPYAPGRIPLESLVLEFGLGEPEDEVALIALVPVLLHALPDAYGKVLGIVVVEDVIPLQLAGVKVDVAAGVVGVAGIQEFGDELDILTDAVGGGLHHVGALDVQLGAVGEKGVGVEMGDVHDGLVLPLGPFQHLVLAGIGVAGQVAHVGDVHDALDVVALVAQEFLQHVLHEVAAQVADMGEVVDGGAAGVHLHDVGMVGNELLLAAVSRIVQIHIDDLLQSGFLFSASSSFFSSSSTRRVRASIFWRVGLTTLVWSTSSA